MRWFFLALLLLSLGVFASSATIDNYTVPSKIPLNQNLTIYGKYSDVNNSVLCSFLIFDLNDQKQVIVRLTDQYTASDGKIYSEWKIIEPLFRRGMDYNVLTTCGTVEVGKVFTVLQKEDYFLGINATSLSWDLKFFTDSNNSLGAVYFFGIILFVGACLAGITRATGLI